MPYKPTNFEETAAFKTHGYKITKEMYDLMVEKNITSKGIFYGGARYGLFNCNDKFDIRKVLQKIMSTQSLDKNWEYLSTYERQRQLLDFLESRGELQLLTGNIFTDDFLRDMMNRRDCKIKTQIDGLFKIRDILKKDISFWNFKAKHSQLTDIMLIEGGDDATCEFVDNIFWDTPFEDMLTNGFIPEKFSHLKSFFRTAFEPETPNDYNFIVSEYFGVNMKKIAKELFLKSTDYLPEFNLQNPMDCITFMPKLTYIHHIKQSRGTYAAYVFFMDQLKQNHRITDAQVRVAAENVTDLILQNVFNKDIVTHSILFLENIGVDTTRTRALLRCVSAVNEIEPLPKVTITVQTLVEKIFEKVVTIENYEEHFLDLMAAKIISKQSRYFRKKICELISQEKNWYKMMLIANYLELPLNDMIQIISKFPIDNVRDNLLSAMHCDKVDYTRFSQRPDAERLYKNDLMVSFFFNEKVY